MLNESNKWKELIIVCDPKALGYFRQVAGDNVQKHVTQTINKNIVNFEANEIKKIIAETLAA